MNGRTRVIPGSPSEKVMALVCYGRCDDASPSKDEFDCLDAAHFHSRSRDARGSAILQDVCLTGTGDNQKRACLQLSAWYPAKDERHERVPAPAPGPPSGFCYESGNHCPPGRMAAQMD